MLGKRNLFDILRPFDLHFCLVQIEGFEVKRVDEYHLTGIALDMFVKWERRTPSSADGRGENRGEGRADGKPKSEQKKFDEGHFTEGMVGLTARSQQWR